MHYKQPIKYELGTMKLTLWILLFVSLVYSVNCARFRKKFKKRKHGFITKYPHFEDWAFLCKYITCPPWAINAKYHLDQEEKLE